MKQKGHDKLVNKSKDTDPATDNILERKKCISNQLPMRTKRNLNGNFGAINNAVYESSLRFFDDLQFLREQETQMTNSKCGFGRNLKGKVIKHSINKHSMLEVSAFVL